MKSQMICCFTASVLLELKRAKENYELVMLGKFGISVLRLPCFSSLISTPILLF